MRLLLFIMVFITFTGSLECQVSSSGRNQNYSSSIDTQAINTYSRLINHNYDIINGKEYIFYHKLNQANPFFRSTMRANGAIYYEGRVYSGYGMIYDIYKDELVINYLNPAGHLNMVSLNKHCVDSFDINVNNDSNRFLFLNFPDSSSMKSGYYEVPFRGKTMLLVKHLKTFSLINGQDVYYDQVIKYLYINGEYYTITSLSKFCRLFGEKKTVIRKYFRSLHASSFRRIGDIELLQILAYNETLK
jgi:hypothetical protein